MCDEHWPISFEVVAHNFTAETRVTADSRTITSSPLLVTRRMSSEEDDDGGDGPSRWRAIRRALSSLTSGGGGSSLDGSGASPGNVTLDIGGGGAARQRGERASYRAPSRRPVAAVVVLLR